MEPSLHFRVVVMHPVATEDKHERTCSYVMY